VGGEWVRLAGEWRLPGGLTPLGRARIAGHRSRDGSRRRVRGARLCRESIVAAALAMLVDGGGGGAGPGGHCSPRQRVSFDPIDDGSQCVE